MHLGKAVEVYSAVNNLNREEHQLAGKEPHAHIRQPAGIFFPI